MIHTVLKGKLQHVSSVIEPVAVRVKDSEILKSHSSIIAETAMINNHRNNGGGSSKHGSMISGLISQLNSSAE